MKGILILTIGLALTLQITSSELEHSLPRVCKNIFGTEGVCVHPESCRLNIVCFLSYFFNSDCLCSGSLVCCYKNSVIKQETPPTTMTAPRLRNLPDPKDNTCGFFVSDKITRQGTRTSIGEFPWLALLSYTYSDGNGTKQSTVACVGTLIESKYVLTTANCINNYKEILPSVRLGDWNMNTTDDCFVQGVTKECAPPAQEILAEKIIIHPTSDIALIRLAHSATPSMYVRPICLPLLGEDTIDGIFNEGKRFSTAGWKNGAFEEKQTTDIRGTTSKVCNVMYGVFTNENTSICTERTMNVVDNGGTLMAVHNDGKGNNYFYAAGILSSNNYRLNLPDTDNLPKDFTRISSFVNWIKANIEY